MKHLITQITLTLFTASFMVSCSTLSSTAPAHNTALENISTSNVKKKDGAMQRVMDDWFNNDWTPTISEDKDIQKKYMKVETNKSGVKQTYIRKDGSTKVVYKDGKEKIHYVEKDDKPFTLQEYVDKASAYRKAHPNDYEHSNVKKLESMPIIGK